MNNPLAPNISSSLILYPEQFYINQDSETFQMGLHQHGYLEVNYVAEGCCWYQIEGRHFQVKKRSLILLDSTVPHRVIFDAKVPCTLMGTSFDSDHVRMGTVPLREIIQNNKDLREFSKTFDGLTMIHDAHSLHPTLKEILDECQDERDFVLLNLLCNKLLMGIARLAQNSNSHLVGHIGKIKEYIQVNYHRITCIEEIAGAVGLNKTYLQRIFKEQVGCTVWQFLTKVRMRQAALLLTSSDTSIGDLDELVGINSRQNFYLLFRKEYGMSPQEYRKKRPPTRISNRTELVRPAVKPSEEDWVQAE